jgi:hypothetical protein
MFVALALNNSSQVGQMHWCACVECSAFYGWWWGLLLSGIVKQAEVCHGGCLTAVAKFVALAVNNSFKVGGADWGGFGAALSAVHVVCLVVVEGGGMGWCLPAGLSESVAKFVALAQPHTASRCGRCGDSLSAVHVGAVWGLLLLRVVGQMRRCVEC